MTTTSIVTVTTARQLIDGGRCSALCLAATSDRRACRCGCGGEFHGRLLDAPVVDAVEAGRAA